MPAKTHQHASGPVVYLSYNNSSGMKGKGIPRSGILVGGEGRLTKNYIPLFASQRAYSPGQTHATITFVVNKKSGVATAAVGGGYTQTTSLNSFHPDTFRGPFIRTRFGAATACTCCACTCCACRTRSLATCDRMAWEPFTKPATKYQTIKREIRRAAIAPNQLSWHY